MNVKIEGRTLKEYYVDNADKLKQYKKQYQVENVDKIKQYKNTKNTCICGGNFSTANKHQHLRTKKHLNYIENQDKIRQNPPQLNTEITL